MAKGPKLSMSDIVAQIEELVDQEIDEMPATSRKLEVELEERFGAFKNDRELREQLTELYTKAGWKVVSFESWYGDYRDQSCFNMTLEF
jgi:hypothetical protein